MMYSRTSLAEEGDRFAGLAGQGGNCQFAAEDKRIQMLPTGQFPAHEALTD